MLLPETGWDVDLYSCQCLCRVLTKPLWCRIVALGRQLMPAYRTGHSASCASTNNPVSAGQDYQSLTGIWQRKGKYPHIIKRKYMYQSKGNNLQKLCQNKDIAAGCSVLADSNHLHMYLNNAIPFSESTVFCSNTVGINLQNKESCECFGGLRTQYLLPDVNPVMVI